MGNGPMEATPPAAGRAGLTRAARIAGLAGLGLAALVTALAVVSGPGYRLGWWELGTGFTLLRWAAYGGVAAIVVSILGGAGALLAGARRDLLPPVLGLLLGFFIAYVPWSWRETARSVPRIHDITTDTESPPEFVAVLPLRADAPNPAEYDTAVAALQQEGYPDLGPAVLDLPPDQAFDRALEAARAMGWEIVAADETDGRVEATATTFWYGFKDDVVVRIAPSDGGARVDVRSVSRVGRSDVGTNAKRIRAYLRRLTGGS